MKFEITDKRKEREGLVLKKDVFLARVTVELTDEEQQALDELVESDEWKDAELGTLVANRKATFDITVKWFQESCEEGGGAWEVKFRADSADFRSHQIEQFKAIATRAKNLIDARLGGLSLGDEDVSMEL